MDQQTGGSADDDRARKLRQKRIGDQLRRLYDEVTEEAVPEEFLNLLEQADNSKNKQ
ncbi:NepR family anti-sigma factor [Henriciella marina]|uniref:NepR family anti-sigma factor n=1 Tax=Henriciella marina TaxID=453851 RepID=A0ABT4LYN7_9PROT|nr:NepR family anti-sigma factor [Henriciella marina]MCH2458087.1 hypothetical protein [Henriciella sp.]MCZ4299488.1 NepR family anti-sigma factor [Henriciella marina]